MIYAFLSGKREQDRYVKAFGASCGAKIVHTRHIVSRHSSRGALPEKILKRGLPHQVNTIIFSGILRGNAHLFELAKRRNVNFYYIDHAYFNKGYDGPSWMRITKNGFAQNSILDKVNENRFSDNFNLTFEDYNFIDKRNIVILPPSDVVSRVFDKQNWENAVIDKLRKHTNRPIVVRRKPGDSIDNLLINPVKVKNKPVYEESLEDVMKDAYCVVAYNSSAALDALRMGVPVICDRFCPAFPLSHSLDRIENLTEKERMPLFQSLAHGQYTIGEAQDPKTFEYLNSVTQWKGPFECNIS